ncbi:MAG: hypothetical protein DDT42_02096 [candidate division WS2 bacterium]|uniref:Uncharacterized protein n=1 Tax=Psychracetigena formicireducens TaxID=2986056 RepID=A0A9E2BNG3_PSYF1|nr:hypothetical protein [Candidatus Psychracetigena formicireducens]
MKVEITMEEIQKILPKGVKVKVVSELPNGGLQILAQDWQDEKYIRYMYKRNGELYPLKAPKF